jgi:lysyl-tRNA synthetase class 1
MTQPLHLDPSLAEAAQTANAWPFEEARKLVERLKRTGKTEVLFETGYGPSGLPHIGTFGEVARTSMVRHAFRVLTGDTIPTRLVAFSDDMDGLRKVPDNVPNRELLAQHLNKPLTEVPDPFGRTTASGATTTRGFAPSSMPSASTTSSSRPPIATARGASTGRCSRCSSATTP